MLRIATSIAAVLAFTVTASAIMPPDLPPNGKIPSDWQMPDFSHVDVLDKAHHGKVTGTWNILVICISFADTAGSQTTASFDNMLFTSGTFPTGSMDDYYNEISCGQFRVNGAFSTTVGWYTAANNQSYYANNDGTPSTADDYGTGPWPNNAPRLVQEAVDAAETAGVDFSEYDNDGDGNVEGLMIIHPGKGAESTWPQPPVRIWSHRWSISGGGGSARTYDGVTIDGYSIQPELNGSGGHIEIGVFCHEFGHTLGLPDLYDTDGTGSGGDSEGFGAWCLMSSGSWGGSGGGAPQSPTHMSAWCKKELGWANINVHHTKMDLKSILATINPVSVNNEVHKFYTDIYQTDQNGSDLTQGEYFLVTYRRKAGLFDGSIVTSGLLIEHVEDFVGDNNTPSHLMVDIEEASPTQTIQNNTNRADGYDVWPGIGGLTTFNNSSNPNSRDNTGTPTGNAITSISGAGGATMTATLSPGQPDDGYVVIYDENGHQGWGYNGYQSGSVRFTSASAGTLKMVRVYFISSGSYTIRVYNTWSGGAPSGLLSTQSGSVGSSGWSEITLSTPVALGSTDDFVVRVDHPTTWVPIDYTGTNNSTSYLWSGGSWTLSSYDFNVRPGVSTASATPPPVASFTQSTTTGCTPLGVNFNDTSTGSPTSWKWYFGDGDSSTAQSPYHQYTQPDTYSVTLIATNAGGSDTLTKSNLMSVYSMPVAGFNSNVWYGCVPLTVNFVDASWGSPSSWLWDFGDGDTTGQHQQDPTHVYMSAGDYTISLIVTTPCGSDTSTMVNYIDADSLINVHFTANTTSGPPPLNVSFTDQSTGGPTWWMWDFGDGDTTNQRQQNPSHVYSSPGTYGVKLKTKNRCEVDSLVKLSYINVLQTPTADFVGDDTSGVVPHTVNFSDLSTGTVSSWRWHFGDGDTAMQQNPSHTYNTPGSYNVKLVVGGAAGSDSATRANYIDALWPPPAAAFSVDDTSVTYGTTVNFTDASTGSVNTWLWDFGDGDTSHQQNPSHVYTGSPKTAYTVELTATGPGGSDTETKVGLVHVYTPPTAAFTAHDTSGAVPHLVNFTDMSTGAFNSWRWDFGDGDTTNQNSQNPTHVYTIPGSYNVKLVVSGPAGADSLTRTNYIDALWPPPVAQFTVSDTSVIAGTVVDFTDASSGSVDTWLWHFGDGDSSTAQNPSHMYSGSPKTAYTVDLTVTGPGGSHTRTKNNLIHVYTPPTADFAGDFLFGPAPHSVNFTDLSTGARNRWLWDFGDGDTTNQTWQHPSHTYANPGQYDVKLRVDGPAGPDSVTKTAYIEALWPPPVADFYSTDTLGLAPYTAWFHDASSGSANAWLWDFGDGDTSHQRNPSHVYLDGGVFDVALRAFGPGGDDIETKNAYVRVYERPDVDFMVADTAGGAPHLVSFTNLTSGSVDNWLWDFGDGDTTYQYQMSPEHVYQNPGLYTVTLRASNPLASDSLTKQDYIHVYAPPAADFVADVTSGNEPLTVNFTDFSTGVVNQWLWHFGDGDSSSARNPTHIYNSSPKTLYTVDLTVTGPGGSNTMTKVDYIETIPSLVVLTGLDAVGGAGLVLCSWSTGIEMDHAGFNIYRAVAADGRYSRLNVDLISDYEYADHSVECGRTYYYKLGAQGLDGREQVFGPVSATPSRAVSRLSLRRNVPNPFNPSTTIFFEIPQPGGEVLLQVLDISGRVARTLVGGHLAPGSQSIMWDGKDDRGMEVGSGIYLIRLEMEGESVVSKVTLLK
jgi:M6 family metalloprotease-like protein